MRLALLLAVVARRLVVPQHFLAFQRAWLLTRGQDTTVDLSSSSVNSYALVRVSRALVFDLARWAGSCILSAARVVACARLVAVELLAPAVWVVCARVSRALPFPFSCAVVGFVLSPGFAPALAVPARFLFDVVVLDEELKAIVAVVGGARWSITVWHAPPCVSHCRAWRCSSMAISSSTMARRYVSTCHRLVGTNG